MLILCCMSYSNDDTNSKEIKMCANSTSTNCAWLAITPHQHNGSYRCKYASALPSSNSVLVLPCVKRRDSDCDDAYNKAHNSLSLSAVP